MAADDLLRPSEWALCCQQPCGGLMTDCICCQPKCLQSGLMCSDGCRLKSLEELQTVFSSAGVDLQQPLVTSCGTGVTACVLALAMDQLQASKVCLSVGVHPDLSKARNLLFDPAGVSL